MPPSPRHWSGCVIAFYWRTQDKMARSTNTVEHTSRMQRVVPHVASLGT